jgi:hypothetical protein
MDRVDHSADDTWHLLYTGVSTRDAGLIQRIGSRRRGTWCTGNASAINP